MALPDNAALNAILALVAKIEKQTRRAYNNIAGNNYVVSLADPLNRPAMPLAVRCAVTNLGAVNARIFESGKQVKVLIPNETWVSPMSGAGPVKVDTAGAGTTISIATYLLNP